MNPKERDRFVKELSDAVWLRMAVVLIPAAEALGARRPELSRLMRRTLMSVGDDVRAITGKYAGGGG